MRARVPTLKTDISRVDISRTDISTVQRENGKPPPLAVTTGGKSGRPSGISGAVKISEGSSRTLTLTTRGTTRRRAQSYKRIPRISPSGDTFVTRPWPRFITRFADVVSPTRTTTETNENEEQPSLPVSRRYMYVHMYEDTVAGNE